ncbi:unnamed protein product [marine sediment metagenome]|uniref:Uncharacterized protein n=1 Tax=marine sediment metagenome TaxID=412755 RepID=X1P4U0_9ZZZZ
MSMYTEYTEKPECFVSGCEYNQGGICTEPDRPKKIGCALTRLGWLPTKVKDKLNPSPEI